MEVERIWLDGLQVGSRLREADESRVASLAASMKAIGLRQPISVWADDEGGVHLVAGLHRVKAAELLKWETIDAILVDMSEVDRRRWEIAENLHRSELTALERDQHVAEWIRLTDQSDRISAQPEPKINGRGRPESGTRKAARELGVEKEDARRAIKVASLTDAAKQTAREVGLDDNRSALLKAAAAAPSEQSRVLRDFVDERARKKAESESVVGCDLDPEWTSDDEASYAAMEDAHEHVQRQWILDNSALCVRVLGDHGQI